MSNFIRENLAADLVVLQRAREATARGTAETLAVHHYLLGRYDATRQIFGDLLDWRFPEDWTLMETARETLDAFVPEAQKNLLEAAIRRADVKEYLEVQNNTDLVIKENVK